MTDDTTPDETGEREPIVAPCGFCGGDGTNTVIVDWDADGEAITREASCDECGGSGTLRS